MEVVDEILNLNQQINPNHIHVRRGRNALLYHTWGGGGGVSSEALFDSGRHWEDSQFEF